MVSSGAILVETEGIRVFAPGEEKPVIVSSCAELSTSSTVNDRFAKGIVFVLLDHRTATVGQMGDTTFLVLLKVVPMPGVI